ncbi:YigZ family protein [Parahaliea sp. F7430]|uniref:YigZ family protein n=1 Tax=Sediminihaliea albiluteola TaxID=2758564 RepID=A0A7W2TVC2_9GAMM|nr:YigZ family protein [Sediminihaliea albiluteola]MBA6412635.1 YigZ family protein [Sediminihaliea albiluteola]
MSYEVPAGSWEVEHLVKKSRFIARILPIQSRADVQPALSAAQADYPDARHYCWAYLLGKPQDAGSAGMSDDGEPAGTAGRPILNVLQHGHLGDVLIIVIRYFGGIKLGAGGLVRAYSAAAQLAVDQAPSQRLVAYDYWRACGDFSCEQPLRHWLAEQGGEVDEVHYSEQVCVDLHLPVELSEQLTQWCAAHQVVLTDLS